MTPDLVLTLLAGAFIVEGLAYALAPSLVERLLVALAAMPPEARRLLGLLTAVTGVILLYAAL
ncbi:DUF2065 domain-containing protein [Roseivivax sp. CAU 1761]